MAESTHYLYKIHLNHWLRHLGGDADRPAGATTADDLAAYVRHRKEATSPATAAKERRTLIQLFKWAVAVKKLSSSPASSLPVVAGEEDRPSFLTLAEVTRIVERGGLTREQIHATWECIFLSPREIAELLRLVRDRSHDQVSFLLHVIPAFTGMRPGEVLRLLWMDVDLEAGVIRAHSRKQKKGRLTIRTIGLHPQLRDILMAWHQARPKGQFVIADPDSLEPIIRDRANRLFWQPMRGTHWCLDGKKNWFKVGFHTYRHSFVSNLAAAGVDQRVIDEFAGHSTEEQRKRYRHLFPAVRQSAVQLLPISLVGSEPR